MRRADGLCTSCGKPCRTTGRQCMDCYLRPAAERLWSNVTKEADGCWIWMGKEKNQWGHGSMRVEGRKIGTHRFAYELFVGAIPSGLELDHLCRRPSCVNPAHLEPVSRRENTLRGTAVTALNARKTHCSNGHEFTPDNIYARKGTAHPQRMCRECSRNRLRLVRSARKLARGTVERQDPVTAAKAVSDRNYHDWQASA